LTDLAIAAPRSGATQYALVPHPDRPANVVAAVGVDVVRDGDTVVLTFTVQGYEHVALPDWVTSMRADDLWKTTCCELFLAAPDAAGYFEFNYSPSTRWAAYRFETRRAGRQDLPLSADPHVDRGDDNSAYLVEVDQSLADLPGGPLQMGLTAVIEETDGTKSYWALAHADGPPDFHNRDCFIATLPAPDAP
jgi:hypothetical protein